MRLGYGPWGETLAEFVGAGRAAEDAGFESLWSAELHRSAFVPSAALASATSRAQVGTGIALAFVRSPMITALSALDLDDLADGRFILGLGTGVQRLNADWHGVDIGQPGPHLRETVALIRTFIARAHLGAPIDVDGRYHRVRLRGYERPFPPRRTEIPIYLASMGPVLTTLAGEIADGWIAHELGSPRYLRDRLLPLLEAGLDRGERQRPQLTVTASACCVPYDDGRQAKRWAAGLVAFYASVRTYTEFFEYHGFGAEAAAIQTAFRAGDTDAMIAACPDAMVDAFTLAGTPDEVRARLAEYEGVADVVKVTPPTHLVPGDVTRVVQERILELFAA